SQRYVHKFILGTKNDPALYETNIERILHKMPKTSMQKYGEEERKLHPMPKLRLPNNHQYKLSKASDQFEFAPKSKNRLLPFGRGDGTLVEEISKPGSYPSFFY
ncbi:hypothetical protein PanWU01x14_364460, partial [Parasponia andersonii]